MSGFTAAFKPSVADTTLSNGNAMLGLSAKIALFAYVERDTFEPALHI